MTYYEFILWLLICLPFFGSFLLPFAGIDSERFRNVLAFLFIGIPLGCAVLLLEPVYNGTSIDLSIAAFPLFHADKLAVFMAFVSLLVGFVILLYSFDYISHYENRNEYFFLIVIFLGSMMGLVFSRNLLFIYLFWEVTAFACWRLIGFYREKICVWRADKAFLVTVFGALMMLIGFIMIYAQTGSFDILQINSGGHYHVPNLAVMLILFGILSKSATLPLHTWLPDAGVAPSPVTALLHAAVLVKIGVYVYARLFVASFSIDDCWHVAIPLIAGISALVSAGAALIETDIKRIIAYSTISQIGFIFFGLSAGNELALGGGLLYILMHGIAKGGLFLCAGIVEQNTHEKDITKLGGL
ncbi:MAG: NADH-quinone oxidoreductase subunit L, partial [SAR324 cluster bacterium]|nr:NADH-quinone oxidoreductase subunit L [SAR324 cluster bacterium]